MTRPARQSLGRSGLQVAPFALGGNVFGWTVQEATGFRLLEDFLTAGFNLIDTADTYSRWVSGHQGGESESLIGRWLRQSGRRKEVLIATKVGMEMGSGRKGLSRKHIADSAEASLKRLQTDYIDLYQAHIDDPETPLEETLEAFTRLRDEGKVRTLGASNFTASRLEEALEVSRKGGWARYESLQPRYNLMDRHEFEDELRTVCQRHDLGVLSYSSIASGFLSGKYRTKADLGKSPRGARAEARLNDRGFRILKALDAVAERRDASSATVALAWLIAQPAVTAPIASATSEEQLKELIAASSLHLSAEDRHELDQASA